MLKYTIKNPNGCCRLCTAKDEEGNMITCKECDRRFHLKCVNTSYSVGRQWFCPKCWAIECKIMEVRLINTFRDNKKELIAFIHSVNRRKVILTRDNIEELLAIEVNRTLRQKEAGELESAKQELETRFEVIEITNESYKNASNSKMDAEKIALQTGKQTSIKSSRSDLNIKTLAPVSSNSSIEAPTDCKSPKAMLGQISTVPRKGPDKKEIMTREVNEAASSKQHKNNK